MSSSRSRSSNETNTQDLRTTNTINAGIGGDIDGSLVNSGNYGDTSLSSFVDESNYESNEEFTYTSDYDSSIDDHSDNSFTLDLQDNSDSSSRIDNSVTNVTHDGAFEVIDNLGFKLIETLGESQAQVLSAANDLVGRSLDASEYLAAQSLDGALSIKAGQTVTEPANQTVRELASAGVKIAAVAGIAYAASRLMG